MQSVYEALRTQRDGSGPPFNSRNGGATGPRSRWSRFGWLAVGVAALIAAAIAMATGAFAPPRNASPTTALASGPALSSPDVAAVGGAYADPVALQSELPWGQLALDLVLKLGLVLALLVGVLWLIRHVRRRGQRPAKAAGGVGFAEVLDTAELAPGQQVYLLDIGDRVLVLGSTAQHVTSLSEITNADEVENLRRRTGLRRSKGFANWLQGAVEQALPASSARATPDGDTSVAEMLRRRQALRHSAERLRALARRHEAHRSSGS